MLFRCLSGGTEKKQDPSDDSRLFGRNIKRDRNNEQGARKYIHVYCSYGSLWKECAVHTMRNLTAANFALRSFSLISTGLGAATTSVYSSKSFGQKCLTVCVLHTVHTYIHYITYIQIQGNQVNSITILRFPLQLSTFLPYSVLHPLLQSCLIFLFITFPTNIRFSHYALFITVCSFSCLLSSIIFIYLPYISFSLQTSLPVSWFCFLPHCLI